MNDHEDRKHKLGEDSADTPEGQDKPSGDPAPKTAESPQESPPRPGKPGRLGKLIAAGIVVVFGLSFVALAQFLPARDRNTDETPQPPVSVRVAVVEPIDFTQRIVLDGGVEPNQVIEVAAEVPGQVETWAPRSRKGQPVPGTQIEEGDRVSKGDPILLIDDEDYVLTRDRTKAQMQYDANELMRMQDLARQGIATPSELERLETAYRQSKAAYRQAELDLRRTVIRAEADGVLNRILRREGEYVTRGMAVAEIVEIDHVKIVVWAPERYTHHLEVNGNQHEIVTSAAGPIGIRVPITYKASVADPATRSTRVEMIAANPAGSEGRTFFSGQIVTVRLNLRKLRNIIMVPLDAVIPLEQGKVVYVEKEGQAHRRRVEIDLDVVDGKMVRVLPARKDDNGDWIGLLPGEKLIVEGHRFVGPGQVVRVKNPPTTGQPVDAAIDPNTSPGATD